MQAENLFTPGCVRTFTGRYINLKDPQQETIFAADIAIGLARAPRFAGHTKKFYSVAQHSDWCRQYAELNYPGNEHLPFKVMMHDAHEYILCDIPSPLKSLMPEYEFIADNLQQVIHQRFGISVSEKDAAIIKEIDRAALKYEWDHHVIGNGAGLPLTDRDCADIFLNHFVRLCKAPFVIQ